MAMALATLLHAAVPHRLTSRPVRQRTREQAAAPAGMGVVSLAVLLLASVSALPVMGVASIAVMLQRFSFE